jgi:flagellum-specific peptidoglycan hydrolase FlgJ/LysM repeat protein
MFKKILALLFISFLVSCGSSRSGIQTRKNTPAKTRTQAAARSKPAIRTKAEPRKATASSSTRNDGGKVEVLESTSRTVVYADLVKQYIRDFKEVAKDNMKRYGIPASITLSQGILESGAGRGTLCVKANNHFGIKCHTDWAGESVYHDDDSEQECFRKYDVAADSYSDHSLFLTTRGRYASLFKLPKDDYIAWARGLKAAGYATDPQYPEKLIGLIERYDLAAFDAEVLGKAYAPKIVEAPVAVVKKETPAVIKKEEPALVRTPAPEVVVSVTEVTAPEITPADDAINIASHKVQQGETLYSISKKHNTTVDELMRLNGLSGNAISIGQVLKVK